MSTRARFDNARGGGWTNLFFLAMSMSLPTLAHAESGAKGAAAGCQPVAFATGTVANVVDARSFALADGREVRLAGIEIPAADGAPARAKERAADLLSGATVVLRGLGSEHDRYGRLWAQVFVATADGERWVQAELVASGHAVVAARVGDRACAAELARRERAARQARLGAWADADYLVRRADDPAAVAAERGRFAIVEGNVLSVRESGSTIYVNFGRRWSEDFTVTIAKRNERVFTSAGIAPKTLAGRRVRVRGWIEERGGPWVEATRPEQIELVERN